MRVVSLTAMSGSELGARFPPMAGRSRSRGTASGPTAAPPVVAGRLGYLRQARRVHRHAAAHIRSRPRPGAGLVAGRPGDRVRPPRPALPAWYPRSADPTAKSPTSRSCCPRSGLPTDGTWRLERSGAGGASSRRTQHLPHSCPGRRAACPDAAATARPVHQSPAFSPDGHRLAFISCDEGGGWGCDVQVLDLDSSLRRGRRSAVADRPARDVSERPGLDERRHLRHLQRGGINLQVNYLWRADADGTRPPERIETGGRQRAVPFDAPAGDRLAFARLLHDEDIYRLEPGRAASAGRPVVGVRRASRQFSPRRPPHRVLLGAIGRRDGGLGRGCRRIEPGSS